eukprot:764122-Hanusia_phi.AAC.1
MSNSSGSVNLHSGMIREYQSTNKRRLDEIRWLRKDCKKVSMRLETRRNSDTQILVEKHPERSNADLTHGEARGGRGRGEGSSSVTERTGGIDFGNIVSEAKPELKKSHLEGPPPGLLRREGERVCCRGARGPEERDRERALFPQATPALL